MHAVVLFHFKFPRIHSVCRKQVKCLNARYLNAENVFFFSGSPQVGSFVRIRLSSGSRHTIVQEFVGRIMEMDEKSGECKLSFMQETRIKKSLYYSFPDPEDSSWELMSKITNILSEPTLSTKSNSRKLLFTFQNN